METKGTECRFRVWLPNDLTGVLDLMVRMDEWDERFYDAMEAEILKDSNTKRFRLVPRLRGRDIPEHLYSQLQEVFLDPVTQGTLKSQKSTVFGKGLLLELNIESGRPLLELEALDVISEAEFRNR